MPTRQIRYIALIFILGGVSFAFQNFHGCCLAPDNLTGWVVTLDSIMVLKTTNGGAYWFEQSNHAATRRFFDVTCRDNLKVWTCGLCGEITHTSDGGLSWVLQNPLTAKYATRIEFIDDTLGWAACGDGLVGRTTDGGEFWEANFTPYCAELYGISFIDAQHGWAVAGWPDSLSTGQGYVLSSNDGGVHWEASLFLSGYEDYFDVHFFNHNEGIVVGGNELTLDPIIIKTTNGGITWFEIFIPDTNVYYLRAVDFVDSLGWAVGRFGTIIHTTDYGNTWVFQTNPATTTLFDVDFSDALHGIACGYGIILYTTDGGQNWNIGEIEGIEETQISDVHCPMPKLTVYPNPFLEKTEIRYEIGDMGNQTSVYHISHISHLQSVSIKIYDATGRLVRDFTRLTVNGKRSTVVWDGDDDLGHRLPVGVYFVRLEANGFGREEKVILLR